MRWTQAAGAVAMAALVPGCAVMISSGYHSGYHASRYDVSGRPVGSYYCYDCHGYRYFDPYYDYCAGYGFRYAWDVHPEAVGAYRARYVQIKQDNPGFGRYRYPTGYRLERRYRQAPDYDSWQRAGGGRVKATRGRDAQVREKRPLGPGMKDERHNGKDGSGDPGAPRREPRRPDVPRPAPSGGG